jgi:membrane protease YdiL (CAAX protease family)
MGRHQWWHYFLGVVLIVLGYFSIGGSLYMLFLRIVLGEEPHFDSKTNEPLGLDPFLDYIALNLSFVMLLLCVFGVVKFLHARPLWTLFAPGAALRGRLILYAMGIWMVLHTITTLIEYLLFPGSFKLSFQPAQFFASAPVILLLTPIQAGTEEVFFRGYLLQGMSVIKNCWLLATANGAFFMLPHLMNPEMNSTEPIVVAAVYFIFGFIFALVTIKTNGLEMAIGSHIANNLFAALFVNYQHSALATSSIWFCSQTKPWFDLIGLSVEGAIFYLIALKLAGARPNADGKVSRDT